MCEWRRRHPAHGDLPGSLAGPVSKPAGTVRSSFLPVVPADGLAGACRGQPGRRGQAPYSLHPRITGPGLEWCEDGVIMRPVRGGGYKYSFLPTSWGGGPAKRGRGRRGTRRGAGALPYRPSGAGAPPLRPDAAHRPTSPWNGEERGMRAGISICSPGRMAREGGPQRRDRPWGAFSDESPVGPGQRCRASGKNGKWWCFPDAVAMHAQGEYTEMNSLQDVQGGAARGRF